MLVFVDASAYLSILNSADTNHQQAMQHAKSLRSADPITSQAVLGEVLTVGSQRYDKATTLLFVEKILNSSTIVVLEDQELVTAAWHIFKTVQSKNISWVDCYSQAIIQKYQITKVFTFDADFRKLEKLLRN